MTKKCYSKEEVINYFNNIIEPKQKKKIEEHIYGKVLSSVEDNELGIEVDSHSGGGCKECFKILAEVIETRKASSGGAEILKHL